MSTHYMDEAHVLCDRICLMDSGQVIALDAPRNLVRSLQSESAIEFRLEGTEEWERERLNLALVLLGRVSEVKQADYRNELFVLYTDDLQTSLVELIGLASREQWKVQDLQTRTATLEDVFIHMTGRGLREQ